MAGGLTLNPEQVLERYVAAVRADLPREMTRIIGALAIASGATVEQFLDAARDASKEDVANP